MSEPAWIKSASQTFTARFRGGLSARVEQAIKALTALEEEIPGISTLLGAFEKAQGEAEREQRERFLWGLVFQAERVLHYYSQGLLVGVEIEILRKQRKSRPDLLIREDSHEIFVEVKNWTRTTLENPTFSSSLYEQIKRYLGLGKPVRLEFHLRQSEFPRALYGQLSDLAKASGQRLEIVFLS